jgi:hypothetical protein
MGNSFRQTIGGIFSDSRMRSSVMLEGHLTATKSRIKNSESEYILVAQDTTFYGSSDILGISKFDHDTISKMLKV